MARKEAWTLSSYEFDREALDEIDYWRNRAETSEERADRLFGHLTNLMELNELQASLRTIDDAIEKIKIDLEG
jgi:hypothetical protein